MDCNGFKEHAGLFALGSLSAEERAACAQHLASLAPHDGCLEALNEAMAGVSALDQSPSSAPPQAWRSIETSLEPQFRRLRAGRWRVQAAVSVALAACVAIVLLWVHTTHVERQLEEAQRLAALREQTALSAAQARDSCIQQVKEQTASAQLQSGAVALLELPGTALFALKASSVHAGHGAAANAIIHTGVKRAYVVAEGLSLVADHDYEMWVAKGTRVVAAGVIRVDDHGRALMGVDYASLLGDVGAPDAMMITLEPHAGSLKNPGPTVLFGTPPT